ncbi:MAG TPA: hypothetical protein VGD83_35350 [Streptosporangiaceae bacterium]
MSEPKPIEDAGLKVLSLVRQAIDHAAIGDYRAAHSAAEQAQGSARRFKEAIATHRETVRRVRENIKGTVPRP